MGKGAARPGNDRFGAHDTIRHTDGQGALQIYMQTPKREGYERRVHPEATLRDRDGKMRAKTWLNEKVIRHAAFTSFV